jgi:hypothetical protein
MSCRREGSTIALSDFLILISKRPIHEKLSRFQIPQVKGAHLNLDGTMNSMDGDHIHG